MAVTNGAVVVGVFDSIPEAERAYADLEAAGYPENELGYMVRGEGSAGGGALATGDTHFTSGAVAGGAVGGVGGAIAGAALAGIIPGIGPLISAGILTSALVGAFSGAVSTGLMGAVVGLGFSDDQAKFVEAELRAGHPVITVRTDRQDEATRIMRDDGARFAGPGDALPSAPEVTDTSLPTQ